MEDTKEVFYVKQEPEDMDSRDSPVSDDKMISMVQIPVNDHIISNIKEEPELILEPDVIPGQTGTAMKSEDAKDLAKSTEQLAIKKQVDKQSEKRPKNRRYNVKLKRTKLDPTKCYICQNVFESTEKLGVHLPAHVDMIPYTCDQCVADSGQTKKCTSLILLHRHFRMHASSIKCPQCPHRMCTVEALYGHMQQYHGEDTMTEYTCEICGEKVVNKRNFDKHLRFHKVVDEGRHTCSFCEKRFANKARLIRHERCHTNERPYKCKFCTKAYKTETVLYRHERTHTGEKGYCCIVCGKSYRLKISHTNHMITAHEAISEPKKPEGQFPKSLFFPEPMKCDFEGCEFASQSRGKYYSHKANHDLKFHCSHCSERFPTRQRLEKHEYVHTGIKPYSCDDCGKRFMSRTTLDEHRAGHTNTRKHACEICGMAFVRERTLKQHRLKHSDALNYECRYCERKFKYRADQSKHERTHADVGTSLEPEEPMELTVKTECTDDNDS